MLMRRGVMGFGLVVALVLSATLFAQTTQQPPARKLTDAQRKDIQEIQKLIDGVMAGQPMPNDLSLAWVREDLLKAQGSKQYVPFTVTIDASKTTSKNLTVYWRVVSKAPATPTATTGKDGKKEDTKTTEYAYEDMNTAVITSGQGPLRISRSFAVGSGSHDVFVVVKEPTPERSQRNAPPLKVSAIRQTVEIPDLWNGELNTSSVFVAQRIDPLPAPLTAQQQAERPYALGTMEILPALDTKFAKSAELSTFLLIYNTQTDSGNKPDVTVEFNFYQKQPGGEKFFNKTNPQNLNAQTLPPQFDFAAGHQLQSGQAVPLATFPEGDYRLEIKVTDKLANKSLTRDVNFTVVGS